MDGTNLIFLIYCDFFNLLVVVLIQEAIRIATQNIRNIWTAGNLEHQLYSLAEHQLQCEREVQYFMRRIPESSTNHTLAEDPLSVYLSSLPIWNIQLILFSCYVEGSLIQHNY